MSVSICSNVPGFEDPCCFISNGDPQDLVNRMGDYLDDISEKSYEILWKPFQNYWDYSKYLNVHKYSFSSTVL